MTLNAKKIVYVCITFEFAPNSISAGAPTQNPPYELTALPTAVTKGGKVCRRKGRGRER